METQNDRLNKPRFKRRDGRTNVKFVMWILIICLQVFLLWLNIEFLDLNLFQYKSSSITDFAIVFYAQQQARAQKRNTLDFKQLFKRNEPCTTGLDTRA